MAKPGKKAERLAPEKAPEVPTMDAAAWTAALGGSPGATPEDLYGSLVPIAHRRRFGQFFTPVPVAELMARWVAGCRPRTVLDPAVGPGVFVRAIRRLAPSCHVYAIDIDRVALDAARAAIDDDAGRVTLARDDFLTWRPEATFDGVLANPPYLKHHNILYPFDIHAEIGRRNGVALSRLTNVYALFILEACRRLNDGGRAALIVPGEWTNANFGDSVKEFLLTRGLLRVLIYFASARVLFDDVLTTASILLVEKGGDVAQVTTAFVGQECRLDALAHLFDGACGEVQGAVVRTLDRDALLGHRKWDHVLEHGTWQDEAGWVPLSRLAATRRGIATGANRFFHVTARDLDTWRIDPSHAIPCVGRATDVAGHVFDQRDFDRLVSAGARTYLLVLDRPPPLSPGERRYIASGEAAGLPSRYLLGGRNPWYSMEERAPAPIWAAVFGRRGLRFVWNRAGVYNLTTFHCVYPTSDDPVMAGALVAVLNSRQVQERSRRQRRVYGGGLLKFEPKDLLDILVPDLCMVDRETLAALAETLVEADAATRGGEDPGPAQRRLGGLIEDAIRQASVVPQASRPPAPRRPVQGCLRLV